MDYDALAKKFGATDSVDYDAIASRFGAEVPQQQKGFGENLEDTAIDFARQFGLTARAGIEGVADSLGVLSSPIRVALNQLPGVNIPSGGAAGTAISDLVGLPTPKNTAEKVGTGAARTMAGIAAFGGLANKAASATEGVANKVLSSMASQPLQQVAGGAGGGAMGEYAKETGASPAGVFGASLLGGFGGAAAAGAGQKVAGAAKSLYDRVTTPQASDAVIRLQLGKILEGNGVSLGQLPADVRAQLVEQARAAYKTGGELNVDAVRRLADYSMVPGTTPTRGTVTLDPVLLTREKNLAKLGANSSDPSLQQLARTQNQNNAALIRALDDLGASGTYATDKNAAGKAVVGAIEKRDANAKAVENLLYSKARDTAGRQIDLDREGFVFDAYRRLAESNKGAFLPDDIGRLLEQIQIGKVARGGKEFDVPFNVDVIDNLKTTLAQASRGAADGNVKAAIKSVRDALENAPIKAVGRNVGGNQVADPAAIAAAQSQADDISAETLKAFDRARQFARSRRNWQESSPGVSAALDGYTPENFIKDFIISGSNKAGFDDAFKLFKTISKDQTAKQAAREYVLGHLKSKALNNADNDVASFGKAFSDELKNIGDMKMRMLFNNEELAQLKAIGRVSRYEKFQPVGSAVNNSNTTAAAASLLEQIATNRLVKSNPLSRVPSEWIFGKIEGQKALSPAGELVKQIKKRQGRMPISSLLALPLLEQQH